MEDSDQNTTEVLISLRPMVSISVSKTKVQISKQQVKYLRYITNVRRRQFSPERKQAILGLSIPNTKKHIHIFWNMAGFCRIWIPGFGLMAKPLYKATKALDTEPLLWNR